MTDCHAVFADKEVESRVAAVHQRRMTRKILVNGSFADSLIRFRAPLLKALVAKGYDVHVSAPEISPETSRSLIELGVKPHGVVLQRNSLSATGDIAYCRQIFRLVKSQQIDFVLNYTLKPNIWGSFAARLAGVPVASMVTGLGFAFIPQIRLKNRLLQAVGQYLYRIAMKANRTVVFQNPDDLADFVAAGCLPDTKKAVIVNGSGVDIEEFKPTALPPAPVFLLIARLLKAKGIEEYVKASVIVRRASPSARFILAGPIDGGPDGIGQNEIDAYVSSGVDYIGSLKDIRPAMSEASAYVLPSYREGTPRTVLEAMAMGRPIITTNAPGCRETTRDGHNGLLVPVRAVDELAQAMLTLAENGELRERMGEASRQMAVERYGADSVAQDLIEKLGL